MWQEKKRRERVGDFCKKGSGLRSHGSVCSGRGLDGKEHSGRRWQVTAGQGWLGGVTAREGSEFSGTGCNESGLFQGTLGGRQVLGGKGE